VISFSGLTLSAAKVTGQLSELAERFAQYILKLLQAHLHLVEGGLGHAHLEEAVVNSATDTVHLGARVADLRLGQVVLGAHQVAAVAVEALGLEVVEPLDDLVAEEGLELSNELDGVALAQVHQVLDDGGRWLKMIRGCASRGLASKHVTKW